MGPKQDAEGAISSDPAGQDARVVGDVMHPGMMGTQHRMGGPIMGA